jgi:ATP-dependent Lon protease
MKKRKSKEINDKELVKKFIKIINISVDEEEEKEIDFFTSKLNIDEKVNVINEIETIQSIIYNDTPQLFQLIEKKIPIEYKSIVLKKINDIKNNTSDSSEKYKLQNWIYSFFKLPFHKTIPFPVSFSDKQKSMNYLKECEVLLDNCTYGMNNVKEQFLQIIGKWIVNPIAIGNVIGLKGPMGVGKTTIIKNGISKILNRPFSFVALGGANDGSYLDGHSYTYEGSTYGKIVDVLIQSKTLNPIIFFDELDKISQTEKGSEIIGILTHITDSTQNNTFTDKYFSEISIDLSKCLFIFSFNDESLINTILKDRMTIINVNGYDKKDKIIICKKYIIPEILKEYSFLHNEIVFNDEIIDYIIDKTKTEQGVRNIKRNIETIISKINLIRIKSDSFDNNFIVNKNNIDDFLNINVDEKNNYNMMYL